MKTLFSFLLIAVMSCNMTRQNLDVSYKLNVGMTKAEVESIMGKPMKSDFYKNVEEWHYCRTASSDEHLALFFNDGKLIAKKNYSVTIQDTGGVAGSCEKFIKMGNYREPDNVSEIRIR